MIEHRSTAPPIQQGLGSWVGTAGCFALLSHFFVLRTLVFAIRSLYITSSDTLYLGYKFARKVFVFRSIFRVTVTL